MRIDIPGSIVGVNQTYKRGKNSFYKSTEAKNWQLGASHIIGSISGVTGWEDNSDFYQLIIIHKSQHDIDAPVKLAIDTLCLKLGFNDKRILDLHLTKVMGNEIEEGLTMILLPITLDEVEQKLKEFGIGKL